MTPHPAAPVVALEVERLSYAFDATRRALDTVSFQVAAGRFTALLGPNGAGKSTLFALATRLLSAPPGTIRVFGADLAGNPGAALARMGVVFQQPTLDLDLSVAQNLRYFATLHGIPRKVADQRMEAELGRLDMAGRAGEKVRALNGGHRRRAEIARALMHRPALLLLDEPTVGLDLPTRRRLIDHVHALCREDGIAALWATHLIDEIDPATDRVVVLHQGRVRAEGDVADVLARTARPTLADSFNTLTEAV